MRSDDSAPRDAGARLVCLFFGGPGGVDRAAPGGGISSLDPGREGTRLCWMLLARRATGPSRCLRRGGPLDAGCYRLA
jgi:hypothetical protein